MQQLCFAGQIVDVEPITISLAVPPSLYDAVEFVLGQYANARFGHCELLRPLNSIVATT